MSALQGLIEKVKQFEVDIDEVILDLVKTHEVFILDLIRNQLFQFGVDGTGEKIKPAYTETYAVYKHERGLPSGHVSLYLEGDFHASLEIEYDVANKEFSIISTDPKSVFLIDRYGEAILDLMKENIDLISEFILPGLLEEATRRLT